MSRTRFRTAPAVMGVHEVVELSGLDKSTVSLWVTRGGPTGMPPATRLHCGPVWDRPAMVAWLTSTGRTVVNPVDNM